MINRFTHAFRPLEEAISLRAPFAHFSLGMTPRDQKTFEALTVNTAGTYDNFAADTALGPDIARFFKLLGNPPAQAQAAMQAVREVISDVYRAFGAETGWVTVRASQPNNAFDEPRWHQDGYFFDPQLAPEQHKAAFVLKGAGTMFAHVEGASRATFNSIARGGIQDIAKMRASLTSFVTALPVETTPHGHGSIFAVGSETASGIHSEPPIHAERIFVSVVPGSRANIEELRTSWKRPQTACMI